ncbi:unnamed protein product, partial [Linum tenue]
GSSVLQSLPKSKPSSCRRAFVFFSLIAPIAIPIHSFFRSLPESKIFLSSLPLCFFAQSSSLPNRSSLPIPTGIEDVSLAVPLLCFDSESFYEKTPHLPYCPLSVSPTCCLSLLPSVPICNLSPASSLTGVISHVPVTAFNPIAYHYVLPVLFYSGVYSVLWMRFRPNLWLRKGATVC